jgi:hypothetical protein
VVEETEEQAKLRKAFEKMHRLDKILAEKVELEKKVRLFYNCENV